MGLEGFCGVPGVMMEYLEGARRCPSVRRGRRCLGPVSAATFVFIRSDSTEKMVSPFGHKTHRMVLN